MKSSEINEIIESTKSVCSPCIEQSESGDELHSERLIHNWIVNDWNFTHHIASVCRKKEHYLQALQNYTNFLETESEILPPNDKKLLVTKNNIGIVHIQLENYTKAVEHFEEIFETE
jgi:tetratricopeptide (TPR) repeat protein